MQLGLLLLAGLAATCAADVVYVTVDHFGNWPVVKALKINSETAQCRFEIQPVSVLGLIKQLGPEDKVLQVPKDKFDRTSQLCQQYGYSTLDFNNYFGLTFPGTKWCGPGDNAKHFDDLGSEWEADTCCRAHDLCDDMMPAFSQKYNLTNSAWVTRLHCDCDNAFIECLKNAKTDTATSVGELFFNIVQNPCYKMDHPIVRCVNKPKKGNCDEYELDVTKPALWQWFESKSFN